MARLERPLNKEAVKAADEKIYVLHADDPRPNALYDVGGKRLKLDATNPAQAGLRRQWCDLYRAALAKKKKPEPRDKGGPTSPAQPPPPPSDSPVGEAVKPCPPELHWIKTQLTRLPDQKPRPDWWPKDAGDRFYPYEPFTAEITDGHKVSSLDSQGFSEYDRIPPGSCSWTFTYFFDLVATQLAPREPAKDAESLSEPLKPHWIKTQLIRLPDRKPRPDWWPKDAGGRPYPDEPFTAEITDRGKVKTALDSDGFSGFSHIRAGSCSWTFAEFFKPVEQVLKPGAPVEDAESLSEP